MRGQKVYKRILDSLMSSVHLLGPGEHYDYGRVYTENEKRQVTPEELMRWLNIRTWPQMAIRPLVHANTVAFWKKQFHSICQIICMVGEQVQMTKILQSVPKSMILLSILGSWKQGNKEQNRRCSVR